MSVLNIFSYIQGKFYSVRKFIYISLIICDNSTPVYYSSNRGGTTLELKGFVYNKDKTLYTGVAKIGSVKVGLLWIEKILLKCQLIQHMDHCET